MAQTKHLNITSLAEEANIDKQRVIRAVRKEKPTNLSIPERELIIDLLNEAHQHNIEYFKVKK